MNIIEKKEFAIKDVFVLTDDYTVIEGLKRDYKEYKFYTLANKSERGYYHDDFVKKQGKRINIYNQRASKAQYLRK